MAKSFINHEIFKKEPPVDGGWAMGRTSYGDRPLSTEYRAVSGVFQNIDHPPPFHPASMSSPRTKGGGFTLARG